MFKKIRGVSLTLTLPYSQVRQHTYIMTMPFSAIHLIIYTAVFVFIFRFLSEAKAAILKTQISVFSTIAHMIGAGSPCSTVVPSIPAALT